MSSLLIAAVALSMLLTPLLLVVADRWWIPLLAGRPERTASRAHRAAGRAGDHRRLRPLRPDRRPPAAANGITPTVLDHDAETVEALRRFGWRVFYGDATRLDLLRTAGAARGARVRGGGRRRRAPSSCVDLVRENFPNLTIVARARNVSTGTSSTSAA